MAAQLLPGHLYKYQGVRDYCFENLAKGQIWYSTPLSLDDPYDCNIRIKVNKINRPEMVLLYEHYKPPLGKRDKISKDNPQQFWESLLNDPAFNEKFTTPVLQAAEHELEARRKKWSRERGVACFSARPDILLMWSHYAIGHAGFCLEYDTSDLPFLNARPVRYRNKIPAINALDLIAANPATLDLLLLTKGMEWKYQQEWRIFAQKGNQPVEYVRECLSGIYFGLKLEPVYKEQLYRLGGPQTAFYQMEKSEDEYKIIARRIERGEGVQSK